MNSIFSFQRFGNLMKKQFAEHYKAYLFGLGAITGVMTLMVGYMCLITQEFLPFNDQWQVFIIGLPLAGGIFSCASFADMGKKNKAIMELTLPATIMEKFIVKWLISYVFFQIVFLGVFFTVMYVMHGVFGGKGPATFIIPLFKTSNIAEVLFGYAVVNALALLGSIFFKRLHFIKTGSLVFVGFVILDMINTKMVGAILGSKVERLRAIPFSHVSFNEGNEFYMVNVLDNGNMRYVVMLAIIALLLWTSAYYKLKEKQV